MEMSATLDFGKDAIISFWRPFDFKQASNLELLCILTI